MPIIGRRPDDCFRPFRQHIASLFANTLSDTAQLRYKERELRRTLAFREGDSTIAIPLDTHYGQLFFSFAQLLEAVKEKKKYRLSTRKYWYRIQSSPVASALLRWEYDSELSADTNSYCRHHVQMSASLKLGNDQSLDLNKSHVPTGWVTIEEVLRFLITELGVQPICGDEWPQRLAESERAFFEKFTSKRYTA